MAVYVSPGVRTPFVKALGPFASYDVIDLSRPVLSKMADDARPDFVTWGQVIPSATISNLARDAWLEADLDPNVPAFSTALACSTSMVAAIEAAGMLGRGGAHLALVGGAETMSRVPIALKPEIAQNLMVEFRQDLDAAAKSLAEMGPEHFDLPVRGWANRISGRSMGEHTEDTAKAFEISRDRQDELAFQSHMRAIAARATGFFDDLLTPVDEVSSDTIPRAESTIEKLATLPSVFDRTEAGTLTAGNSTPLTDGAAGLWVSDDGGLSRLADRPLAEIVDWRIEAMDYREEGILMAPARAIPKLLAANDLRFEDISLFELHEAFAAQVLANIDAMSDTDYRRAKAGVDSDLGDFPWERLNPNGGSLAIGHPFGATGARILSQAVKELHDKPVGAYAVVSVCADGGQGSVMLLRSV